jgi:hypothetical protein
MRIPVISGRRFWPVVEAVPAFSPVFHVPPMVEGVQNGRPISAHKIWGRKKAPSGALSSLRGQVYTDSASEI